MQTLQIQIQDSYFQKFLDFINSSPKQSIEIVQNEEIYATPKDEIIKSLKCAIQEVNLEKKGKIEFKSARDFLNEL